MNIESFDLERAVAALLVIALAHYLFLRRSIRSVFDPVAYVALSTAFGTAMTYALVGSEPLAWRVAFSVMSFWIGWRVTVLSVPHRSTTVADVSAGREWATLKSTLFVLSILVVVTNLGLWAVSGVPALADDVNLAKTEGFSGGLGFVRRINWGAAVFVVMGLTLWMVRTRGRLPAVLYAAVLGVLAMSGAKSALLPAVFAAALTADHPDTMSGDTIRRRLRRLLLGVAAPAIIVGILLLHSTNDGDESDRLTALVVRLFYFGDVMLYWSDGAVRQHFSTLGPLDYLQHIANPLLGLLRIVDYQVPLGNLLVQQSLGANEVLSESLGPNTPFYVKGEMFFGPLLAPLYAFIIGVLMGTIRLQFARSDVRKPLAFCFWGTLAVMAPALPTEDSLYVSTVIDLVLVLFPVTWLCSQLAPGFKTRPTV